MLLSVLPLAVLAAAPERPPAGLDPYVREGRLDPGDYRWLRGGFRGATAAEAASYRAIVEWRRRCRVGDMSETRAELAGLGVIAGASLDATPYRTLVCSQAATLPENIDLRDWDGFASDVALVRPIVRGFLAAVGLGEASALGGRQDLRDALNARVVGEQTLRAGLDWAEGSSEGAEPMTGLTLRQRGIIASQIATAMKTRDHANTAWLKEIVVTKGWPRRSEVGETAARRAWLLVQHADADPAFQVRALRLMEPLVKTGEASARDFAYLYDRVMLKLIGRQRYGTQLTCGAGGLVPLPLEDEGAVEGRRREAGLGTVAEHVAASLRASGPCAQGTGAH